MTTTIALWIAAALLVAYLVGEAARIGEGKPPSACNQGCLQGQACRCADPLDGETRP